MARRTLIARHRSAVGGLAWFSVLLVGWLSLSACDAPGDATARLQVGDVLPPLAVIDLNGQAQTLRPTPDKLLILNVWATWCAPCRHELPSLQRLLDELDPAHFELVLMSVDDDAHLVREFLIERKMQFTSLLDIDMSVAEKVLGIRVYPSTYFVRDGRIVSLIEGARDWDSPEVITEINNLLLPAVEAQR